MVFASVFIAFVEGGDLGVPYSIICTDVTWIISLFLMTLTVWGNTGQVFFYNPSPLISVCSFFHDYTGALGFGGNTIEVSKAPFSPHYIMGIYSQYDLLPLRRVELKRSGLGVWALNSNNRIQILAPPVA